MKLPGVVKMTKLEILQLTVAVLLAGGIILKIKQLSAFLSNFFEKDR